MERLWAPWRIKYIQAKAGKKCIFCEARENPRRHYCILKTHHWLAMLNIFPYNNGHVMLSPLRHIPGLNRLKEAEIIDLFKTLKKTKQLLDKVLKPHGYNIGINLSKSAGAGITTHLHIHIVPRWQGDTNFMPVLFNAKIISQSLAELYKEILHAKSKTD